MSPPVKPELSASEAGVRAPREDATMMVSLEETEAKEEEKDDAMPATAPSDGEEGMPQGLRLKLVMASLLMTVFITSLDQTIVAPSLSVISNAFHSTADTTWYLSAYLISATTTQPMLGKIYRFSLKTTFIASLLIFELGSLLCAVAQNSPTFIVGRIIAGVGVSGTYLGVMTIVAASVPLPKRPMYASTVSVAYGVGAVVGPLAGGAFTTHVSWRWCFYINLPLGAFTLAVISFFFHPPSRTPNDGKSMIGRLLDVDWGGTILLNAQLLCLILALQDGGLKYAWSDRRIWGLILGFGLITLSFVALQVYLGDRGVIPPRLMAQRTIAFGSVNFCIGGAYFAILPFLSILFEVEGDSAMRAGVKTLPMICGVIVSTVFCGRIMSRVNYANPFIIVGMVLFTLGSGPLVLFNSTTPRAMWVCVTLLIGIGSGATWQSPFIAAQAVKSFPNVLDMQQAASLVLFYQRYGGAIISSVSQSIFANQFLEGVERIPEISDPKAIAAAGETAFRELLPAALVPSVEAVAISAVQKAFIPPIAVMVIGCLASLGVEWNPLKKK